MAVYPIPNQAFDLTSGDTVYCRTLGRTYYQLMPKDKCTTFQVSVDAETNVQLFSNPNLDNLLETPDGWEWDTVNVSLNQAKIFSGGQIWQQVTLEVGKYYQLCVEITEITVGQALAIVSSDATIFLQNNAFNSIGTHCVYFYAVSTNPTFYFYATGVDGYVTMDSASLLEISVPNVEVQTCEGTTALGVDIDVEMYANTSQIKICWEQLVVGCYKVCVSPAPEGGLNVMDGQNNIITEGGRTLVTEFLASVGGGRRLTWIQ